MLPIEQILILLAEGPRRIAALAAGLPPARLHSAPNDDEWSANDVLAHLRACADVWGGSIVTMVREDHPTIRAINPRTWIRDTDYLDRAFRPSLRAYTAATHRAPGAPRDAIARGLGARGNVHGGRQAPRADRALRSRRDRAP